MNANETQQLELVFATGAREVIEVRVRRGGQRDGGERAGGSRAGWWFQQMHQAVERALDWRGAPRGRPEQVQLILG